MRLLMAVQHALVVSLVLIVLCSIRCGKREDGSEQVNRLIAAAKTVRYRSTVARLSGFSFRPIQKERGNRHDAADGPSLKLERDARQIIQMGVAGTRSRGIAYLLVGDTDAAVEDLTEAASRSGDAAIWSDLAGALITQCDAGDRPGAALDGLAAADRALEIDPRSEAALFNRALALERLGLRGEASTAWSAALASDLASPWSAEARDALYRLRASVIQRWSESDVIQASLRRDDRELDRLVIAHPKEARGWGEGASLGKWADAAVKNDKDEARSHLEVARSIGAALKRTSGDQLLISAVDAIAAAERDDRLLRLLARAHIAYRDGRIAFSKQMLQSGESQLREAERLFESAHSPMVFQARYYVASVVYERGGVMEAEGIVDSISKDPQFRNEYSEVGAEVGWIRGLCLVQRGSYAEAIAVFDQARRTFQDLGETERAASLEEFLSDALEVIGDVDEAWRVRRKALERLAGGAYERRRIAAIAEAAERSIANGDWRRAGVVANIEVDAAEKTSLSDLAVQAHLQRSRVRAATHDRDGAQRDLDKAHRWLASVRDEQMRTRLAIPEAVARAVALSEVDPKQAAAELTAVLVAAERSGAMVDATRLYLERARALRRSGNLAAARSDLSRALDLVEHRRTTLAEARQRVLNLVRGKEVFDEAISLALLEHDSAAAFDLSERARARSLLEMYARSNEAATPLSSSDIRSLLADDAAVISFSLLGDRITTFVLRHDLLSVYDYADPSVSRISVECARAVQSGGESLAASRCSAVHLSLLGAAERDLVGIKNIAFVSEPALGELPYAELRDDSGRPLNERFSITESPSATIAIRCAQSLRARGRPVGRAVVVAANEFPPQQDRGLRPLEWVATEARDVAAFYRDSELISGTTATRVRVIDRILVADTFHFAGHAIASSKRPDQSRLILTASDGGASDLDALAISRLMLNNMRVVYLSACRSGAASHRSDGVDNLALSFIVAGAPTVIATRWDIEDRAAANAARVIHAELARGEDAAAAVARAARLLRKRKSESDPAWPALAVFGGSRYLIR